MRKFFTDRTPPDRDQIASIYDSHAPTWLRRESRAETRLASEKWRNDLGAELRGDVLEIGIAAGDTFDRLQGGEEPVSSFTGIDVSPGMIEQAKRAASGLTIPVALHVADAENLEMFADDSFDTVTTSLVFCTIPDVPKALAEITRVLKPDGRLVMIEHVLSPNRLVAAVQRFVAPIQIRHMGCHLDRETVQTLHNHGFRIEEHRQRVFGVMRFVIARPPAKPLPWD